MCQWNHAQGGQQVHKPRCRVDKRIGMHAKGDKREEERHTLVIVSIGKRIGIGDG